MSLNMRCENPSCRKPLAIKDELEGKRIKCPICGQVMWAYAQTLASGPDAVEAATEPPRDTANNNMPDHDVAEIERFSRRPEPTPPMAPSPSTVDCIDWQAAWANLEGDRNLLSELALMFLDDLPQQMEAIHRAVDSRQNHDLERLAHRMKGSVGNFAAKPAFEAAFHLEKIALQGDFKLVPLAVDALEYEIRRLQGALEEWAHKPAGIDGAGSPLAALPPPNASSSGLVSGRG